MVRQFDVQVGDGPPRDLPDHCAVDEMLDRDQHAFRIDRMVGRQEQVPMRHAGAEGIRADTHRHHLLRVRMPPGAVGSPRATLTVPPAVPSPPVPPGAPSPSPASPGVPAVPPLPKGAKTRLE
jgi:hypothetical protein